MSAAYTRADESLPSTGKPGLISWPGRTPADPSLSRQGEAWLRLSWRATRIGEERTCESSGNK
jgi:hypothetical protein